MKHTKQMLAVGVLTAAVVGGSVFALSASAQSDSNEDSLASKLASRFNLNEDEVKTVLDEHRSEMREQHKEEHLQRLEERLTKAVEAGDLTEEQKTKILDYLKTQEANLENLEDKTREERKAAFDARRDEIKKWAEDNGIDEKYLLFGGGGPGHGHGPGRMEMKGDKGSNEN